MGKKAADLIDIIDKLIHHHEELLAIEQEKVRSVVDQDWKGLERLVAHGKKVLKAIEDVEKARRKLLKDLGPGEDAALSEVAGLLPKDDGRSVLEHGGRLRGLIEELRELAKRSEGLIQSSLEVVNFSISLFSGATTGGKTYLDNGTERNIGEKHTSLVFDAKA
jgi:flagellar biosynthesis/type III secretory pathway chaperone